MDRGFEPVLSVYNTVVISGDCAQAIQLISKGVIIIWIIL